MIDIIINYHKRILNNMLEEYAVYEDIIRESKTLDDYVMNNMK